MPSKSAIQKWLNKGLNLVFYFCVLLLVGGVLQLFVVTSFKIPSDSMEPALLAGDRILVDKCSGGARLFDITKALKREETAIYRMPGWRRFQREDVLVFNFPYPGRWDSIGFDVMKYYVKRCIAIPGDTLEIRNAHYRVRGVEGVIGHEDGQNRLQQLMENGEAKRMRIVIRSYPKDPELGWSIAEFGPLYIPRKGDCIAMNRSHAVLYKNLIEWEQKKKLRMKKDSVWLGDSLINSYHFRENYYFVSGDKIINSRDSRYWGLLPEPFIVGRVWRVWKSADPLTGETRWNRIGKKIK